MFPFGWLKLLSKTNDIPRIRLISTNVIPEYQKWGLGVVLLVNLIPKGLAMGMKEAEFSWVFRSEHARPRSLEKGGAERTKTYRLYDFPAPQPAGAS